MRYAVRLSKSNPDLVYVQQKNNKLVPLSGSTFIDSYHTVYSVTEEEGFSSLTNYNNDTGDLVCYLSSKGLELTEEQIRARNERTSN